MARVLLVVEASCFISVGALLASSGLGAVFDVLGVMVWSTEMVVVRVRLGVAAY